MLRRILVASWIDQMINRLIKMKACFSDILIFTRYKKLIPTVNLINFDNWQIHFIPLISEYICYFKFSVFRVTIFLIEKKVDENMIQFSIKFQFNFILFQI